MESRRVFSNSLALILQDISGKLIPLVTFPVVVRALGPETYGKYAFAMAVTGFFGLLASPGFTAYGMREVARTPEHAAEIFGRLTGARTILALTSYFGLLVYTFTLAPSDWQTRSLLLLCGLTFLIAAVDPQWVFLGLSRMWRVSNFTILGRLLYAAPLLLFVRRPTQAWILPVASVATSLVVSFILLRKAKQDGLFGWPRFFDGRWSEFLPICFTLGLASMMSIVYDQIDTVMLRYMRTEMEVGLYTASYRIMTLSMSFLAVGSQVFFPLFSGVAGQDAKREKHYMQMMTNATLAVALPIATGGFLLATPISSFLLGSKYTGADRLLRWLMFNLISAALAVLFASRLVPHGRERKYLFAVIGGAVSNVVLNLIFIPRYGAMAAVWTTIFSQACVALMAYVFTRDLERADFWRALWLPAIGSGLMAAGLLLIEARLHLHVIVLVGIGAAIYGAVFVAGMKLTGRTMMGSVTSAGK